MENSDTTHPFACAKCGQQAFKLAAKPQGLEDFVGAVCKSCGHTVTTDDINAKIRQVLLDNLKRS